MKDSARQWGDLKPTLGTLILLTTLNKRIMTPTGTLFAVERRKDKPQALLVIRELLL